MWALNNLWVDNAGTTLIMWRCHKPDEGINILDLHLTDGHVFRYNEKDLDIFLAICLDQVKDLAIIQLVLLAAIVINFIIFDPNDCGIYQESATYFNPDIIELPNIRRQRKILEK